MSKKKKSGRKAKEQTTRKRVEIGARFMATPTIGDHVSQPMPCTVIYMNEKHRFFRARFDLGFTQCFPMRAVR